MESHVSHGASLRMTMIRISLVFLKKDGLIIELNLMTFDRLQIVVVVRHDVEHLVLLKGFLYVRSTLQ